MTFQEIVNAVLMGSFGETKRGQAKTWVNARLGKLLDIGTWTFTMGTDAVTVTAGALTATGLPTNFAIAHAVLDPDGVPLEPFNDPTEFLQAYQGTGTDTGTPEAFTVLGSSLLLGPRAAESSTAYTLVYELAHTDLSADGDVPIIPSQYHLDLVHGAKAEGMRMLGIPLWQEHEESWQQAIATMQLKYLAGVRAAGGATWS